MSTWIAVMRRPRTWLMLIAAVALLALSAQFRIPLPGTPVPQTLQTLVVVLIGAFLGRRLGPLAIVIYIVVGALGAPIFAGGSSGVSRLVGPTGGFFVGFIAAAGLVGHATKGTKTRASAVLGSMLTAHLIILLCGFVRLAVTLGPHLALAKGVTPFAVGALVKSGLGALVYVGWQALLRRR